MALIVKCRSCRSRIAQGATFCPACGSSVFRFIIDYWPQGRAGGRRKITLPKETRSLEEARRAEREFLQGRRKQKTAAVVSCSATVESLFPDYLSWYRQHRAATTWHDVSGAWERDLKRIMGRFVVRDIDASHYSLYQKIRGKVSNRTINKELDYFSGFLRWCRREKKIEIPRIDYERLPAHKPVPIVLSPDEIMRILSAAEPEPVYHALILCLYTLGLRISAARGIKVEDIDFENRSVRVLQKGGDWKLLPLSDHMIESIKRVIALRGIKQGFVFSVRREGKPVQNVRKAIARICKRAGIVKKVHPHLFRHTAATHLMVAGVPTSLAQNYMDHREIQTTIGYTHIALENLRSAQEKALSTKKLNENAERLYEPEYNI